MNKIKYIKTSESAAIERINVKKIARGVLLAVIICLLLLIIGALILTYSDLEIKHLGVISKTIFLVGAMLGGTFSAMGAKKSGWLLGGAAGLIYSLLIAVCGMLTTNVYNFGFAFLKSLVLSALFGAVGGIAGINLKLKKRK